MVTPPSTTPPGGGHRRLWRTAFIVYAMALLIALLWPALQVPAVIPRPDLIAHGATFGAFTWLAWRALCESGLSHGRALLLAVLGGIAFGGATELLQAIPIIRRTCAWDDFFADDLGVALGALAAWVTVVLRKRLR
jgi:hypothetical protein